MIGRGRPQVRDVERDSEALAHRDRLDAGAGQPAPGAVLGRPVGEHRPAEVREGGDPDPEPVERLEQGDVRPDRLAALEREDQRDQAVRERRVDVLAGEADPDRVRVRGGDPPPRLEHPQRLPQGTLGAEVVVDEDRKDLDPDAAGAQLGQPVPPEVLALGFRRPARAEHQEIVMGVDDDRSVMQRDRFGADLRHAVLPRWTGRTGRESG